LKLNQCVYLSFLDVLQAKTLGLVQTKAKARVNTTSSGTATIDMHAHTPNSIATSSVRINIRSGSASDHCSAQSPPKKKKQNPQDKSNASMPMLLLPPWDSTKL
jgi:hypothetical protein